MPPACALLFGPSAAPADLPDDTQAHRPAAVLSAGTFALVRDAEPRQRLIHQR
jgi:hypothetical protein